MRIAQGPLGAANQSELGHWLGISRNRVQQLLGDLGVQPHGRKYPWRRVMEGVLALAPEAVGAELVDDKLMSLVEAAEELGQSTEELKGRALRGDEPLPPLYVFGPKRQLFIRSQLLGLARSPRNRFPELALNDALFMSLADLASKMGHPAKDLASAFEAKVLAEPKHVVLTGGVKRYFKADVLRLCPSAEDDTSALDRAPEPVFAVGVLGAVARSVVRKAL
ncbi:hypothetical protein [Marinovum sp.]|uniref:hypothetical protein n=1 Tax=Marinovum sp. TaxID=2024839 RepID=UPI003A8EE5A1